MHASPSPSGNAKKPKTYSKEITLKPDTTTTIRHNLGTRRLRLQARHQGKNYKLRYKVMDNNTLRIENRDTVRIKLTVAPGPNIEDTRWYKLGQHAARLAMSIRNFSFSYRNSYAMTLPGFLPSVGDMLGQKKNNGLMAPGLDFAFGLTGDGYIDRARERGWLAGSDSVVSPASTNAQEDLQMRMTVEPLRDLKIDLNAQLTRNNSREIQFMFDNAPETRSGNFSMTIISIRTAFERHSAGDGYRSQSFERFLSNLDVVRDRVEAQYTGAQYPVGSNLAGQTFDPANGTVDRYSPDVMIPAFLAAYTGRDASKVGLDLLPGLLSLMPNWSITYSGLSKLPWVKKHFRSVNLNHAYRSTYSVGSYNTFQSFMSYMGDLGFVEDVLTGNPVPSTRFDIGSVSINEQFAPFFGIDLSLKNGMTAKAEYRKTRVLTLSTTALQIVETSSDDLVLGLGYKINNFRIGGSRRNVKNSKSLVTNDLTLRADVSLRSQSALCRDIQTGLTQATTGNRALKISCTADYNLSRMLTLRLYYDRQQDTPLISSSSYPVVTSDFGVTLKFSLNR